MKHGPTPEWVTIGELAELRGKTYHAVRQMLERLEESTGRQIRERRKVPNSRGEVRWTQGVATDTLLAMVEREKGEAPALPEVAELRDLILEFRTELREIDGAD